MMNPKRKYEVDYNFVTTKNGTFPMRIAFFDTEEEAKEFAADFADAEITWMDCYEF